MQFLKQKMQFFSEFMESLSHMLSICWLQFLLWLFT